jgi:hypothetical protein
MGVEEGFRLVSLGCIDVGAGKTPCSRCCDSRKGPVTVLVAYPSSGTVTTPAPALPVRLDLGLGAH